MSELSPTELVTYLAHIVEDGVSDGVAGRNIVRHFESQRQRVAELEAEVKDVLECVYIPGVWACNQCEFQLIASNLYVQDGTIGPDTDTVPLCPNDGALMRRVTWKERVSGLDKYAGERLNEIDTLKARVSELEALCDDSHSAMDEHMQIHANVVNRVKELEAEVKDAEKGRDEWETRCRDKWDATTHLRRELDKLQERYNAEVEFHASTESKREQLEAEVARLNKVMDPIDQECCQLQEKWKAEAQWAAKQIVDHGVLHPDSQQDIWHAQRILDGKL